MYAVYSFPNVVLPVVGGCMISKFGNRAMYIVYGLFVTIGQFIFAYGCGSSSIKIMLLGRVIFGLGGEGVGLCLTGFIIKWFYMNQISLPLGLSITISRIGSVLNGLLSPQLSCVIWK